MLGQIIEKLASPWVEYNQRQLINDAFRNAPPIQRAVDVGCGEGSYSFLLLERFPNCHLLVEVDVNRKRITVAKQRRIDSRLSYVIANTYALPFRTSAFELAFSKDLLHHIQKPAEGLKEMNRVSIGEVVLVEANRPNQLMLLWTKYFNHQHLTWSQLTKIISRASLKLKSSKQIQAYPLDLLLLPIKNPMMLVWNLFALIVLVSCNLPRLSKIFLDILSFASEPAFNVANVVRLKRINQSK